MENSCEQGMMVTSLGLKKQNPCLAEYLSIFCFEPLTIRDLNVSGDFHQTDRRAFFLSFFIFHTHPRTPFFCNHRLVSIQFEEAIYHTIPTALILSS